MQVSIDQKVLRDRLARLLRMQGSDPGFFVLSVHSLKPRWFWCRIHLPYLPAGVDVYDSGFNQAMVRNTLYVCLTRAMEQLAVIMPIQPDPGILSDLVNAFEGGAS